MSEIFDITVEVRGFAARRAAEVVDAIRPVLAAAGQAKTFSPVERGIIDGERVLRVRGDQIEGSFEWLESFESVLETAVDEANGSPCQLLLFSATGIDELDAPERAEHKRIGGRAEGRLHPLLADVFQAVEVVHARPAKDADPKRCRRCRGGGRALARRRETHQQRGHRHSRIQRTSVAKNCNVAQLGLFFIFYTFDIFTANMHKTCFTGATLG